MEGNSVESNALSTHHQCHEREIWNGRLTDTPYYINVQRHALHSAFVFNINGKIDWRKGVLQICRAYCKRVLAAVCPFRAPIQAALVTTNSSKTSLNQKLPG